MSLLYAETGVDACRSWSGSAIGLAHEQGLARSVTRRLLPRPEVLRLQWREADCLDRAGDHDLLIGLLGNEWPRRARPIDWIAAAKGARKANAIDSGLSTVRGRRSGTNSLPLPPARSPARRSCRA
jgi:hypothetical protein